MINHYLYIENGKFNWLDGVFSGIATVTKDKISNFCLDQADKMRNSNLGNYDHLPSAHSPSYLQKFLSGTFPLYPVLFPLLQKILRSRSEFSFQYTTIPQNLRLPG